MIDFHGAACLTFDYHIHGLSPGILSVHVIHEDGGSGTQTNYANQLIFSEGQYDLNEWQKADIKLELTSPIRVSDVITR